MSGPCPITPLRATAATRTTLLPPGVMTSASYGDGRLDARVRVVALHVDVLELEGVDLTDRRVEPQLGLRPRVAGQLEPRLVEVVEVEVGVAQGVHEVADVEVGDLGDHVREQGVRRDVERHTEEHVGGALVELAAQPAAAAL